MEVEPEILSEATPDDAESLTSRLDPDTMANEQTWPTEDEMQTDRTEGVKISSLPAAKWGTTPKVIKKVPKGTSTYQAAWITDDDQEDNDDDAWETTSAEDDAKMDEDEVIKDDPAMGFGHEDDEGQEMVDMTQEDIDSESKKSVKFEDLDMDEENDQSVFPYIA